MAKISADSTGSKDNMRQKSLKEHFPGGSTKDIAEYLESLRWIEETLFQWASIVESAEDAIIGKNLEGVVTSWNPAAEKLYGYSTKEIVGRSIKTIFPPDRDDELETILAKIKQGQQILHYETQRVTKDGVVIDVSVTISPIKEISGRVIGASVIARDITEKKVLDEQRRKLAAIIDSSDDAIISKTLEGIITSWNRGAEKIYGYAAEEVIGKPVSILIPPDSRDELPQLLKQVKGGNKVDHYESKRVRKDGKTVHVSVTISPIKDSTGNIVAASSIARDITHQVEYERLKELEARKDEFISMASHELRTPVTTIKIHAEILRQKTAKLQEQTFATSIDKIEVQIQRLTRLIDELLTLTRIQEGRMSIRSARFDLSSLITEVVEDLVHGTGREIIFQASDGVAIVGDRDKITQVLVILLNNAIKYSSEKSKIILRLEEQGHEAKVSVRDAGIGITQKHQEEIFERFYQVPSPVEKTYPGLGMGLFIAREIIHLHGGRIWVESAPHKGSTFSFTIPAK